ncbi:MAG: BatA domain-containing protein [Dyadobacter fermentans]
MTLLQPYMLWGLLAVAIPVAIHFWYQKKGRTIAWAATRWLGEQTALRHRGFRLNEVLLMLLRCLLVALLAFILSKPITDWFGGTERKEVIHVVQADRAVLENYRFELEKALAGDEKMYWLGASPERISRLENVPMKAGDPADLQQNINALAGGFPKFFKLYFNSALPSDFQRVYVPGAYQLFAFADTASRKSLVLREINAAEKAPIQILLDYSDAGQRQTMSAALAALAKVHGFLFEIETQKNLTKHYDWIFTDQPVQATRSGTTYVVSGNAYQWGAPAQVVQLPERLLMAESQLVETARLPEWLGDLFVKEMGLQKANVPLSTKQLNASFEKSGGSATEQSAVFRPWLLLAWVLLLVAERWLSLLKPVGNNG